MKTGIFRRMDRGERGQSLVELAISLIVILYLLLGAVEFSMALFQYVTIRDAAQEGANFGSINPAPADYQKIKERVKSAASDFVPLEDGNIAIRRIGDGDCEGLDASGVPNAIEVKVTFSHQIFLPFVTTFIGNDSIDLTAITTNTILQPGCP